VDFVTGASAIPVKVRFAPSPTGLLHVGNARVALVNWLFARRAGGRFLLRLDDTDTGRSTAEFAQTIEEDLRWLGLEWDEFAVQSARAARYEDAAARLKESGRLYPCYETAEELSLKRKAAMQAGRAPVYDRVALRLDPAQRTKLEAEGRQPHWRFALAHEAIAWDDLARGRVEFEGANLSDPVLVREDGRPLYTLSSVVDDIDLGISHVMRGEDHVSNTAVQIQLAQALGGTVPVFAHLPLLVDAAGQGLSKRLGSLGLRTLRAEGIEAMAVNSYLARLGTPDPVEPHVSLDELVATFDIGRFGRAAPRFDPEELRRLNARLLHITPYESVRDRLPAGLDVALWEAVRPNLTTLADAMDWHAICRGPVTPVIEDAELVAAAAELLPPEPWDGETWRTWTEAVKARTGRTGKRLFRPLRLALTGLERGPELRDLLPLIGRARAAARLRAESA
jgi:glutamyl-tRNA synthetase